MAGRCGARAGTWRSFLSFGHRSCASRPRGLVHHRRSAPAERRQPVGREGDTDLRNDRAEHGQSDCRRPGGRHRSRVSGNGSLGRQVLLHGKRRGHRRRGPTSERARVVGRRPASRAAQPWRGPKWNGPSLARTEGVQHVRPISSETARGDRHVYRRTGSCASTRRRFQPSIVASR